MGTDCEMPRPNEGGGDVSDKNNTWAIGELRRYVTSQSAHSEDLVQAINSTDRYFQIFRYHFHHAKVALAEIVPPAGQAVDERIKLAMGLSDQQLRLENARVVSEANLLGCLHATRAIYDIFSNLVNSLVLKEPISERACNIWRITNLLPDSQLKEKLSELLSSDWFIYLSAFVNISKHRQLTDHEYLANLDATASGFCVASFSYGDKHFERRTADDVLRGTLEIKNAIVECGVLLNELAIN